MSSIRRLFWLKVIAIALVACGGDDTDTDTAGGSDENRPTVVATTSLLGDVLENLIGDQAEIVTIMPAGVDPHDFQASARQANQVRQADVLVVNGAGFEEGLLDVVASAESDGVPTHAAISAVDTISFGEEHADGDANADEEAGPDDENGHDPEGVDPHFFTDPARMADAAEGISDFLGENVNGIDLDALEVSTTDYVGDLRALDVEVEGILDPIDGADRVLVTNHEVFSYFAARYDFELVGAVIPSATTASAASAGELADLASTIREEGVGAIFADTSSADELAQTLAEEVGDIEVVELFSESLGGDGSGGETYIDMVRTNAERIAEALG